MDTANDDKVVGNVILYDEVLTILPEGVKAISVESYGTDDHGEPQLKGEYTGMLELYNTAPHMTPKPYGWGRVASEPCLYFYVCDFIPLTHAMPEPVKLAKLVANLHRTSVSPTGKFGFHLPTYDDTSMETTLAEVIPRFIGILERDGRSIKPCLIHGDLWETNIGTDATAGNIYIFDAAVYYAHNEMEIGIWRVNHHKMKAKIYRQEYAKQFKRSDPVDEWDDRLKLYGVKTKLMYSAGVPGGGEYSAATRGRSSGSNWECGESEAAAGTVTARFGNISSGGRRNLVVVFPSPKEIP
ncbi:hypothetical protein V499_04189 [Pseudogymnoascus sp. VKM F-103]|nr:hypothetical protein V499_04189 [Pseudogymnoascus sp. VKM F-103]